MNVHLKTITLITFDGVYHAEKEAIRTKGILMLKNDHTSYIIVTNRPNVFIGPEHLIKEKLVIKLFALYKRIAVYCAYRLLYDRPMVIYKSPGTIKEELECFLQQRFRFASLKFHSFSRRL
jgi:hypothetical protein